MTESEVHELIGMLQHRYPEFPTRDVRYWVESLAMADAEVAFQAVRTWCKYHMDWPTLAELGEITRRMTDGIQKGKQLMWNAYLAECNRQGRDPTFEWLMPEAV